MSSEAWRQVMALPEQRVHELTRELLVGDPWVQLAASLGLDSELHRTFVDRWGAGRVLGLVAD